MRWSALARLVAQRFRERIPLRLLRIRNLQSGADVREARFNALARFRECTLAVVMARAVLRLAAGLRVRCQSVRAPQTQTKVLSIKERLPVPYSCVFLLRFVMSGELPDMTQTGGCTRLFGVHV